MKKLATKTVGVLIVLSIIISVLTGCTNCSGNSAEQDAGEANNNYQAENSSKENENDNQSNENNENGEDDVPGKNPTDNPDAKYWGNFVLNSADDLMLAMEILKTTSKNDFDYRGYSFDDKLGSDYKIAYLFTCPNAWITYPITFDEYFTNKNIATSAMFDTKLYYIGEVECQDCIHGTRHSDLYKDSDMTFEYRKYPLIEIITYNCREIEEVSLLTLDSSEHLNDYYQYKFSYEGAYVFELRSCVELSAQQLSELMRHVVIIE